MKFSPKSEKEIRAEQLWPAGEYQFEILERAQLGGREWATCELRSQTGKDMIQLIVQVKKDAQSRIVIDYLMPQVGRKLRHAADACGLLDEYEAGELHAEDFVGSRGRLRLRVEHDRNGQYADKNAVADYIRGSYAAAVQRRLSAAE